MATTVGRLREDRALGAGLKYVLVSHNTKMGAAKGAVDVFTRGLAKELAPAIRVNAVAPGFIRTPFHDKVSTPQIMETSRQNTPLKRLGQAEQIAEAIRFLVESDFITGETIDVNGGLFMR
jgi:3-oxoacyl-[acyl-carrier protein] reductase